MAEAGSIWVVGSLHHDLVLRAPHLPAIDETVMGSGLDTVCGGKGGNQAVAAARLGGRVQFSGCVGDDESGRIMLDHLKKAGVATDGLATHPELPTGMSVAIVNDAGDYGAVVVSGSNQAIDAESLACPKNCSVLVLQNEVPTAINATAARLAREAGATVIWNAAPFRKGDAGLVGRDDLLVANRGEAAALFGQPTGTRYEVEDLLLSSRVTGPTLVTLGAEGCVLGGRNRAPVHFAAETVAVASSHGAGDTFVGALAAEMAAGTAIGDAIGFASRAAARWVSMDLAAREDFGRTSL